MPKEICPSCAEKGDKSQKDVKIRSEENREIKEFSPCGHRVIKIVVEETMAMSDKAEISHIKKSLGQEK
jgi:hypothetical protein